MKFMYFFLLFLFFSTMVVSKKQTNYSSKIRTIVPVKPFLDDYSILSPFISEVTLRIHYQGHQISGYISKVNAYIRGMNGVECSDEGESLLFSLAKNVKNDITVRQAAAQAFNHAFYFAMLRKNRTHFLVEPSDDDDAGYLYIDPIKGTPMSKVEDSDIDFITTVNGKKFVDLSSFYAIEKQPALIKLIKRSFTDLDNFKNKFTDIAANHFGSGWIWLLYNPINDSLSIEETHDGKIFNDGVIDTPMTLVPIAVLDVWEHAYYLDYQNRRKEYISAWFNAVDWSHVSNRIKENGFEKQNDYTNECYTYPIF